MAVDKSDKVSGAITFNGPHCYCLEAMLFRLDDVVCRLTARDFTHW